MPTRTLTPTPTPTHTQLRAHPTLIARSHNYAPTTPHAHSQSHFHIRSHIHSFTRTHARTHTYIHTHVHTCLHTHTLSPSLSLSLYLLFSLCIFLFSLFLTLSPSSPPPNSFSLSFLFSLTRISNMNYYPTSSPLLSFPKNTIFLCLSTTESGRSKIDHPLKPPPDLMLAYGSPCNINPSLAVVSPSIYVVVE